MRLAGLGNGAKRSARRVTRRLRNGGRMVSASSAPCSGKRRVPSSACLPTISGRSGSAYAAALGTMKLNEEVDALRVLGLNPNQILVLPRILGMVIAMGLRAMGVADDIVHLAFGLTLGAIAVAVALSFGLGGREAAGKQMEHWLGKLRGE